MIQPTTDPSTQLKLPDHIATWPAHVAFSFGAGAVGLREGDGAPPSLQEVRQYVQAMRDAELDRYKAYGDLADVKEAVDLQDRQTGSPTLQSMQDLKRAVENLLERADSIDFFDSEASEGYEQQS